MKHLEKITLSNIRRFGENVEINLAKGATIFLAPNGTGKTAIFEAIELALTGKVKRLIFPPEPLIRDHQLQASIKLDFEDGKFCEAIFKKGSEPLLKGDHVDLFGKIEQQDLPFLLQLTHFLNQQGNNWFVNSHGPDAGSQLDHLSIGREATEVNQLIPSAKRAAGNELQQAQREFDETDARLQNWLLLVNKRNNNGAVQANELIGQEVLLQRMNAIAAHFVGFPLQRNFQLLALKLMNGELKAAASSQVENLKRYLIELKGFEQLVPDYQRLSGSLTEARRKLTEQQDLQKGKRDQLNTRSQELSDKNKASTDKQNAILARQGIKAQFNQLQLLNAQIESLEKKALGLDVKIKETSTEQDAAQVRYNQAKETQAIHQLLVKREQNSKDQAIRLETSRNSLENWRALLAELNHLAETELPLQQAALVELKQKLKEAEDAEQAAKNVLSQSKTGLTALNQANDTIKLAVGNILANYPKDKGDCPVCGEVYTPNELQRRMIETADKVHPGILALAELVEKGQQQVAERILVTESVRITVTEKEKLILEIESGRQQYNRRINELINLNFSNCNTLQEAEIFIQKLADEHAVMLNQFKAELRQAPPKITEDQILVLTEQLIRLNQDLVKYVDDLHKISVEVTDLIASRHALSAKVSPEININSITAELQVLELELNTFQKQIGELKKDIESLNISLDTINNAILKEELNISQISTQLSDLRSRWSNAKLSSVISSENLSQAISGEEKSMLSLEKDSLDIDIINRELGKWQAFEDDLKVEAEIKALLGERSEPDFLQMLEGQVAEKKGKLQSVTLNIEILTVFSECLSRELDVIHERITSINPLWKKLLKRIIIDPRFSQTKLDSFSYYKKQHANVNVKLHGGDVLVSQVASEAQITDLQLTFLLAMAQKYQWTPWKSLLLDDPTQHHDLVHASAVFDLLRDYIVDHDFQILMATHDSVQAKFFMRKLENDGIPVNLVTLYAGEDGVEARVSA